MAVLKSTIELRLHNFTLWNWNTVCFISFATIDDDVTQKLTKIIKFWKKSLKDKCPAFFYVQFLEIFEKKLMLLPYNEKMSIFGKQSHFFCFFSLNNSKRAFFSFCFHEVYWTSLIYIQSGVKNSNFQQWDKSLKICFPDTMTKWFISNCKDCSMNVKKGSLSLKKSLRIVHEKMPDIYLSENSFRIW